MRKKQPMNTELSACEKPIMKIVWETEGDIALQDLITQLRVQFEKDYARTTVVTFVTKLTDKGYVSTYRIGRASYVHAEKSMEEYTDQRVKNEISFWFGGQPSKLLSAVCHSQDLTKEEIKKMSDMLEELGK